MQQENEVPEKDLVLEFVREALPLAEEFFSKQFYKTPITTISYLKGTLEFYLPIVGI